MRKLLIIGCLFLLALIIGCSNNATGNTVADGEYVTIPLSDLSNSVQFYSYNDKGININYFAVLGSDGQPRTAFDACDVCSGSKGYRQSETDITCNNCGKVFRIDGLGTQNKGYGCWPSYLPHEIKGNEILIKISDIQDGRHRFV
jgi:uncharacterized membrane protein